MIKKNRSGLPDINKAKTLNSSKVEESEDGASSKNIKSNFCASIVVLSRAGKTLLQRYTIFISCFCLIVILNYIFCVTEIERDDKLQFRKLSVHEDLSNLSHKNSTYHNAISTVQKARKNERTRSKVVVVAFLSWMPDKNGIDNKYYKKPIRKFFEPYFRNKLCYSWRQKTPFLFTIINRSIHKSYQNETAYFNKITDLTNVNDLIPDNNYLFFQDMDILFTKHEVSLEKFTQVLEKDRKYINENEKEDSQLRMDMENNFLYDLIVTDNDYDQCNNGAFFMRKSAGSIAPSFLQKWRHLSYQTQQAGYSLPNSDNGPFAEVLMRDPQKYDSSEHCNLENIRHYHSIPLHRSNTSRRIELWEACLQARKKEITGTDYNPKLSRSAFLKIKFQALEDGFNHHRRHFNRDSFAYHTKNISETSFYTNKEMNRSMKGGSPLFTCDALGPLNYMKKPLTSLNDGTFVYIPPKENNTESEYGIYCAMEEEYCRKAWNEYFE